MAFLQRAGATSFSFLRVIQGTQQTLWSTAQWPRKKTRHTMSFTHKHILKLAHYAFPPFVVLSYEGITFDIFSYFWLLDKLKYVSLLIEKKVFNSTLSSGVDQQ